MRTLFLFILTCLGTLSIFAQTVPQEINYQAVVRDSLGAPLPEGQSIDFTVVFYNQSSTVLSTQNTTESIQKFGVVSFPLDASSITDKSTIYSIEVSATGLGVIGNTVLKSVPYALYSEGANKAGIADSVTNLNITTLQEFQAGDRDTIFNRLTDISVSISNIPQIDSTDIANMGFVAGGDGIDGQSAYELWIADGNIGTETDFLNSLIGTDGVDGTNGTNGQSAYELWIADGNTGTETDFLNSLVGANGSAGTNGTDGVDGTNGTDGQSAYQVWVADGNTGTESVFLNSLIGANGANGSDGQDGTSINIKGSATTYALLPTAGNQIGDGFITSDNGHLNIWNGTDFDDVGKIQGPEGVAGSDGANGIDGQSAYELWIADGNSGTESDFLNSLVGTSGLDGADGTNGTNGVNGVNGQSAYEIWIADGNTGTESDFLNSLQGDPSTDNQTVDRFDLNGDNLRLSLENDGVGNNTVNLSSFKDNLGNHTAEQNIQLAGNWISHDGGANEGIYVNTDGDVGIGIAAPESELHIYKAGGSNVILQNPTFVAGETNTFEFKYNNANRIAKIESYAPGGNDVELRFTTTNNNAQVTNMVMKDGNVGIGNTTPSQKLDVNGTVKASALQVVGAHNIDVQGGYMTWNDPCCSGGTSFINQKGGGTGGFTWEESTVANVRTTNMTLSGAGNLGIGTTTPGQKLTIAGTGNVLGVDNASSFAAKNAAGTYETFLWPRFTNNGTYLNYGTGGFYIRNNGSVVSMILANNGSVRIPALSGTGTRAVTVTSTGQLGVTTLTNGDITGVTAGTGLTGGGAAGTPTLNVIGANGLTHTANDIRLGGALFVNTNINLNGNNLNFNQGATTVLKVQNNQYVEINRSVNDSEPALRINNTAGDAAMSFETNGDAYSMGIDEGDGDRFKISRSNSNVGTNTIMTIEGGGDVGIGTTDPEYPLQVKGNSGHDFSSTSFKETLFEGDATNPDASMNFNYDSDSYAVSIFANDGIAADDFVAKSDERIKKNINISDANKDLETMMQIEIANYVFKDSISKGKHQFKKVIAQQVKEVYPQAVSDNLTDVIPDIYANYIIENGWIQLSSGVSVNDKIKIYYDSKEDLFDVLEVSEKGFKIDIDYEGEVFVYGHQVNDFHVVDYEAISMLNVSATQEIYRHVQELEEENKQLKEQNSSFENRVQNLEASLNDQIQNDTEANNLLQQLQERLQLLEATNTVGQK